jgi:hypothetical protein
MRTGSTALVSIMTACLLALCLGGCTQYGSGSSVSGESASCADQLAAVVSAERSGDQNGAVGASLDQMSDGCSNESRIATDYLSTRSTAKYLDVRACKVVAQRIRAEALTLLHEDGLCTGGKVKTPSRAKPAKTEISWNFAIHHVGEKRRVCGPLAGTGSSGTIYFLDLGRDYPNPKRFQILVLGVGGLQPIHLESKVCVRGTITKYNGVAQIRVHSPSLVKIYTSK